MHTCEGFVAVKHVSKVPDQIYYHPSARSLKKRIHLDNGITRSEKKINKYSDLCLFYNDLGVCTADGDNSSSSYSFFVFSDFAGEAKSLAPNVV